MNVCVCVICSSELIFFLEVKLEGLDCDVAQGSRVCLSLDCDVAPTCLPVVFKALESIPGTGTGRGRGVKSQFLFFNSREVRCGKSALVSSTVSLRLSCLSGFIAY